MKSSLIIAMAIAAAATTPCARADMLDVKFSGNVATQTNSGFAIGAPISGEFVIDTVAVKYLSFTVGGQSVAPGYASTAAMTPDLYSAIYQAQVSPVLGGSLNSSFTLDLEGLAQWPSAGAVALLGNASQLATNLDTTGASGFGYYIAKFDGTDVHAVNAALGSIQVSAVPEPASAALLLVGIAAFGLHRAARRRNA